MYQYQEEQDISFYQDYLPDVQDSPSSGAAGYLWIAWGVVCALGLIVVFGLKQPTAGAAIIAVPTGIGMLLNTNFAFYVFVITLPMFSGVGFGESFTLTKAVGYIFLLSFILNAIVGRIKIKFNVIVWLVTAFCTVVIVSLAINDPIETFFLHAFTYFQLAAFFCMIYWLLGQGENRVLLNAARSYLVGVVGLLIIIFLMGGISASMMENKAGRLSVGVGGELNSNELAVIIGTGLIIAVYLLFKRERFFWKILALFSLLVFPLILIFTGSRGTLMALFGVFTLPYIVTLKPKFNFKIVFVLFVLLCLSMGVIFIGLNKVGLDENLTDRLTNKQDITESLSYRMYLNKTALAMAVKRPIGTGMMNWMVRSGADSYPHNDFCFNLGLFGVPAVILLVWIWLSLGIKIKKLPLSNEKMLARSFWLFYLIVGLKGMYTPSKLYWLIFALITVLVEGKHKISSLSNDQQPCEGSYLNDQTPKDFIQK